MTECSQVGEAPEKLAHRLGRPFVETLRGSRHANMKELRPRGGYLRILFVFDPRRVALLLITSSDRGAPIHRAEPKPPPNAGRWWMC
jgi:hypothetical protein